jgi:multidrug efflux pump subunit AcrA (membrane-fusion protein)
MSWWTKIRDTIEAPQKAIWNGAKDVWNAGENVGADIWHRVTGSPTAQDRRNQQNQINAQIKAYQDQTNLEKQQLDQARDATQEQKRQIEEKQIRSMRRNYRAPSAGTGLLGVGGSASPDMNNNLGGQ